MRKLTIIQSNYHFYDDLLLGKHEQYIPEHLREYEKTIYEFQMGTLYGRVNSADITAVIRKLNEDDVLLVNSLLMLSVNTSHAIKLLEAAWKNGVEIYVLEFSHIEPYSSYRSELHMAFSRTKTRNSTKKRRSIHNEYLLMYASRLRHLYPPVRFDDIEEYTGIPRQSIRDFVIRTWFEDYFPNYKREMTKTDSRSISKTEIQEIAKLKKYLKIK